MARRGIGRMRAGGSGWTPLVFGSRLIYWNDPSDLAVTWQDSARTTAGAVGSAVGSRQNKGTGSIFMQQATGASRPILRRDANGNYYDELDGLDDSLGSSAALDLSAFNKITVCIGVGKDTDAAGAIAVEHTANATTTDGGFFISAPDTAAANYGFAGRGTVAASTRRATTYTSPIANVITCFYDNTAATVATQVVPRINGATPTLASITGPTTTGSFANATFFEGRRNNLSAPLTGKLYQRVIVSGALTADEQTMLERFVGGRMGISL